jgi:hypothetical protein
MTVDAGITVQILRDIRDEMRGMRGELNERIDRFTDRFAAHAETTDRRLETIEHTLADFCRQHLMLTRYVGNAERRQDSDIVDLRTRVERLERRKKH